MNLFLMKPKRQPSPNPNIPTPITRMISHPMYLPTPSLAVTTSLDSVHFPADIHDRGTYLQMSPPDSCHTFPDLRSSGSENGLWVSTNEKRKTDHVQKRQPLHSNSRNFASLPRLLGNSESKVSPPEYLVQGPGRTKLDQPWCQRASSVDASPTLAFARDDPYRRRQYRSRSFRLPATNRDKQKLSPNDGDKKEHRCFHSLPVGRCKQGTNEHLSWSGVPSASLPPLFFQSGIYLPTKRDKNLAQLIKLSQEWRNSKSVQQTERAAETKEAEAEVAAEEVEEKSKEGDTSDLNLEEGKHLKNGVSDPTPQNNDSVK